MPPHQRQASRRVLVPVERSVYDAGHCFCITYDFYLSDLMHFGPNWVVPRLSQLCKHSTRLPTPSSWKSTRNWCHRIENQSLFALQWCYLCQRGISIGKLKIYTINGSKYCAKDECKTMRIAPRRHEDPSSGATRPSDVAVTVNINTEFHLSLIWWQ
jgi:hypothetical protein